MTKVKHPFYLNGITITILLLSVYLSPLGFIFLALRFSHDKKAIQKYQSSFNNLEKYITLSDLDSEIDKKSKNIEILSTELENKELIKSQVVAEGVAKLEHVNAEIESKGSLIEEIENLKAEKESIDNKIKNQEYKLSKITTSIKSIQKMLKNYSTMSDANLGLHIDASTIEFLDSLSPTVTLKLNCMDIKDLRKSCNDTKSLIEDVLKTYEGRYTTKANAAIYKLMVIALQAELQNILYNLKYDKLENSLTYVDEVIKKYIEIAGEGNQNIASTLVRFIGEIEQLFITLVKIEYEYYVRKERAKEEQQRLREIMRQEAEERKILEEQRKQIEAEESKYKFEINKLNEQIKDISEDDEKYQQLLQKIAELEGQLDTVEHKKDEIINLQNGKAGYVYIISNLGSFGDDVFKIGMTRRLDPQDRVNELGDASVPFSFDVHSFIFSDNAVELENQLHNAFNDRRLNKINLRKEFFRVTTDELEIKVNEIDPTAAFNRTMLAEQFRQSISIDEEDEMTA